MPPLHALYCFTLYYLKVFRERRNIILAENQNSPVARFAFVTESGDAHEGILRMWVECQTLKNEWVQRVTALKDRYPDIKDPGEALQQMLDDGDVPAAWDMAATLIQRQCLREGIVNHWSLELEFYPPSMA